MIGAQTLLDLTQGLSGLAFAYGSVQAPMWIAMARGRAALDRWLASPLLAAPLLFAGGIAMSWVAPALRAADLGTRFSYALCSAGLCAALGYAGGRVLASAPPVPREQHVRGAVVRERAAAGHAAAQRIADRDLGRRRGAAAEVRGTGLTLAGVAVAEVDETKHFKLIGATGAGKSTAIRELLAAALARGDRAVIADPDAGYLGRFFEARRGDAVLSPFERGARRWDLFGEITDPYDIDELALALIPDHEGSDRSWRGYARTLFVAVTGQAREAGVSDVGELYDLLVTAGRGELKVLVGGTPAQPFFDEHNERMLDSIRSVLSSAVGALRHVARQQAEPLCVRGWVQSGEGALFIPYRAGQIASLRSMISGWMRLAIFEAMNGPEGGRPLWFVADELDALGAIDGLKDALARLRKFGGRCVLGLQSIAQVSSTYGAGEAQTIVENCGNTLILRCSASEHGGTSRFASRLIGEREVVRLTRSKSKRPGDWRASVTDSEHRQVEPAVMASEIERLADLAGYLKLASSADWRRVALRVPGREVQAPATARARPAAIAARGAELAERAGSEREGPARVLEPEARQAMRGAGDWEHG
jgi:hypothetical protein